jgi:hypothetical protein
MAKQQTTSKAFHAVAGAILVSFGLLLLFANLDEMAAQVSNAFSSAPGPLVTAIELGVAGLRAVQTYFFDPSTFEAGLHLILVSFWPLILVIIGATLLKNAIGKRFANSRLGRTFSSGEYE